MNFYLPVQVVLNHQTNPDCEVPKIAERANQENLIDVNIIQRDWEGQIRTWTSGGVRVLNMHRLVELEIAPLKLGPPGRRKVPVVVYCSLMCGGFPLRCGLHDELISPFGSVVDMNCVKAQGRGGGRTQLWLALVM